MAVKSEGWKGQIRREWKSLAVFGVVGAAASILFMAALEQAMVIYVSALKRFSIPVTVILGFLFMDDSNPRGRLGGAILTTIGAVLIVLA